MFGRLLHAERGVFEEPVRPVDGMCAGLTIGDPGSEWWERSALTQGQARGQNRPGIAWARPLEEGAGYGVETEWYLLRDVLV
jgi:hypothetical protein